MTVRHGPRAPTARRWAALALAAVTLLSAPAVSLAREAETAAASGSLAGGYLAGRFARGLQDTEMAAEFFRGALARDPENPVLLEQSFLMELSEGRFELAAPLAVRVAALQPGHRMARTVLALVAFKSGDFVAADTHLAAAGSGPIGELTSAMARSWVLFAKRDTDKALAALDIPRQAEWAQFYLRYHRGLIADVAGRRSEARSSYERVFKQDARSLRTTLAYVNNVASGGDLKLARSLIREHLARSSGEGHPLAIEMRDALDAGRIPAPIVATPSQGLAEVFYGLGEALTGEGGIAIGIVYLQLALHLEPEFPFALAALANALETAKRYDDAIAIYDRIPRDTPLDASIEIRKAYNLNLLDQVDEAKTLLELIASRDPTDIRPLDALGGIMRSRKRYEEAAEFYTRAIATIQKPDRRHWTYWYSRGTCYERLKRWDQAEADLQRALTLYPDQPLVLNYLGYSWIDQGRNLKQGLAMVEKAVSLKPDDGYIVDSLGWAHYRLGNFKEAVRYLERAVELRPEDPVLNDHLGDALWKVGREREARFQWSLSLSLGPEPEDAVKTKRKLTGGLEAATIQRPAKKVKEASPALGARKRVESKSDDYKPFVQ